MQRNNTISPSSEAADSVLSFTRDEKPLHYTLQIQSFSLLKTALAASNCDRYESQIFNAGGYKWKLAVYPNGDVKRNGSDHISLYLVKAEDGIPTSEVNVVFTFLVYDNLNDKYLAVQDEKVRRFHSIQTEWEFEKLISLETFNDSSNGFLVGDCCAFGVDIVVKKCDGKGEVVSFIKEPKNNEYTWKTNNFSQLDKNMYESDPFTVEGYRCFKELPQGSQVYTEFEIAVLSKYWFEFGDLGLGFRNFMSLRDLNEVTKGYICDDTLIVEVKINVVSTLKLF
ncbi:ubiquitin carboxyl-terminal hydrolase 13-like [Momordica charantia]|uniref:Ubiquitin carboxyl-terminal hydrolase 13-like n=1 Tax=Momordica charantia TaxID=3673 RepID=A0A6J1CZ69_MOMCH|nr:ubiquitin carboxyl-terminal hydrolase 13-like [Momordica charantia]